MFRTPHLASMKTEEKFMFLIYELFLGLSRGEETFDFGKCYASRMITPGVNILFQLLRVNLNPSIRLSEVAEETCATPGIKKVCKREHREVR